MENETINIVVCGDHQFVMPIGVLLYSICVNNQDSKIRFFLITDESFTHEDKSKLENTFLDETKSLEVIYVDEQYIRQKMQFKDGFYKVQICYRLFLSDLLPKELDKVIYLDGDIIVRNSLIDFWNIDVSNVALGACTDAQEGRMDAFNRLGYPSKFGYFNSGSLLINLAYWRENHVLDKFIEVVQKYPEKFILKDQDILNYVFYQNKLTFSFRYNLQSDALFSLNHLNLDYWKYHEDLEQSKQNPVVLHFSGYRPWEKGCAHPYIDEFFKYRQHTAWKDEPLWKNRMPWILKTISRFRKPLHRFGVGIIEDPFDRTLKLKD